MANLKKILIVPLDWGLGHATRSIPLIVNLLACGCQVYIAGEGPVLSLLQTEFPQANFLALRGYRIHYATKKKWLPLKILLQVPAVLSSIYREHRWLKRVVKEYSFDAVISDNRFGIHHSHIPSIYITHQLLIKTGNRLSEYLLQKCNYWFIKKFTQCWVPDFAGGDNIAGELSHPAFLPGNVKYIGCISRFEKKNAEKNNYDLLILLSGPEPQRTIFENQLLFQLKGYAGKVLLVRGLPDESQQAVFTKSSAVDISVQNHLGAEKLCTAIEQSSIIICRSGYTTIMDLIKLQKKAILVPTPGQTEQQYLGEYLMQKHLFFCVQQHDFLLEDVLEHADAFNFFRKEYNMGKYKEAIGPIPCTTKLSKS